MTHSSLIPSGANTYSKCVTQRPGNSPTYAVRGYRQKVQCSDGRWYTDWTAALGPIVLGYRNEWVDGAVHAAVDAGPNFGLPTELEEQVAERLVRIIPCAEAVRFGKSGSDATTAAVRAARAITGRDVVLSLGYHGWHDWCCPNPSGIPVAVRAQTRRAEDWRSADLWDVAGVIIEPDTCSDLPDLRAACDASGAFLIFDEVLTGFRLHLGGAQAFYGVTPDLATFSKAMANGYSISAVVGSRSAMSAFGTMRNSALDDPILGGGIGVSSTFFGETIGLAAAGATIDFLESHPVIQHNWRIGQQLQDGWNVITKRLGLEIPCEGNAPRTVIRYPSMAHKTLILEGMWNRGQMFTTGFTPTFAHDDSDVDEAMSAAETVLISAAANWDHPEAAIRGPICGEVFRR